MNAQTVNHTSALLGVITALLFVGCATTDEIILDSTKRPPSSSIDMYADGKIPDRDYKEIAELSFLGPREDELRAKKRFIDRAKQLGGDGVIFIVSGGELKGGGTAFQTVSFVFKGKVIVYE